MKNNAAEYFTGISPLKGWNDGGSRYEQQNGRSGRCHCCPYGYHIDLDFVRYCETVTQGSKNDNPTLRQLKKLKRARRRQTKSMEVLLGLDPGQKNDQQQTKLEIIEEPPKSNSHSSRRRTPPPPPPRRSRSPLLISGMSGGVGGPPPDVINSIAGRHNIENTINNSFVNKSKTGKSGTLDPGDALQEAVLDFEEMLESSREKYPMQQRSDTLPPSFPPSLDLLHHTQPARSGVGESGRGVTVTRSHSLPRTWFSRPLYSSHSSSSNYRSHTPTPATSTPTHPTPEDNNRLAILLALRRMWGKSEARTNTLTNIFTNTTPCSLEESPILGRHRTSSISSVSSVSSTTGLHQGSSHYPAHYSATNGMGVIQQGWAGRGEGGPGRLADTLTALNAARGCYSPAPPMQDFDTMSISSAMSGVSTTTLQSIRDQMATSLSRLKDLEEEVKTIPMLQIKVNVLSEEKRLLMDQVRALRRGEEPAAPLLPPTLDPDLSEEELEGRLASLRSAALSAAHSAANSRHNRHRSPSPLRVNLEEFRSHRRARRGSLSEGSDTESGAEDMLLHISEPNDRLPTRRRSLEDTTNSGRVTLSLPSTPALSRRSRDAATTCRVITRDVGVSHIGVRTRSVGVSAVERKLNEDEQDKGCQQCWDRNNRTYVTKCVGTPPQPSSTDKVRRLSLSSVSLESVGPEEAEADDDGSHKSSFLRKLGRNSAIISRLSEPQLTPPPLTFDNSTNTEPVSTCHQGVTTTLTMCDVVTRSQLSQEMNRARAEWEATREAQDRVRKLAQIRPLTLDVSTQATDTTPARTVFQPLMQSVGCQAQPTTSDRGVGIWQVSDTWCEKCSGIKTRSVACGAAIAAPSIPCQRCTSVKTRTVGTGNYRLNDTLCQKCAGISSRSVGCGTDPIPGCQRCAGRQTRSLGVGTMLAVTSTMATQTRLFPATTTHTVGVQTRSLPSATTTTAVQTLTPTSATITATTSVQTRIPATTSTGVNTTPLSLRKEELGGEIGTPSPAGTPEVERRTFGSSGVRVCDKCHAAITSLAQDIVGTTGPPTLAATLPPLPPHTSKIPRLVDITKVEPRVPDPSYLDSPRTDCRGGGGPNQPDLQPPNLTVNYTSATVSSVAPTRPARAEKPSTPTVKPTTTSTTATVSTTIISKPVTPSTTTSITPSTTGKSMTSSTIKTAIPSPKMPTSTKSPPNNSKVEMGSWWQNTSTTAMISPAVTTTVEPPSTASSTSSSITSSPQTKRVPYSRQTTYTKYPDGVVNLAFDANSGQQKEEAGQQKGSAGSGTGSLPRITEGEQKAVNDTGAERRLDPGKDKEKEEDHTRKKSSELEPVSQAIKEEEGGAVAAGGRGVRGRTVSISSYSSPSDSEDEEGGSVVGGASLTSQLDLPTSSFHSVSSLATATSERSHKKSVPSREMKAALKVLNDSLGKSVRSGQQLTNALNIIQREWLKISSGKDADPHAVEDYMDVFEDYSKALLQRVVNLSDVNGNTAMHYAVSHGNFDVVSVLLDSRVCNVNQQNKAGYTAAMLVSLAVIRTEVHTAVVKRLFQMADVNIKASQHGQTALMLAVSHGRLDMVRLLVGAGADVNIQDEDGSTALMCAAEHGHLPIVGFLLALPDTDPTLMDHDGSTALTIAVEAGHKDVGVLLYKHMNLSRGSSPYSSVRIKRSRTPTILSRSSTTPPPRSSAPTSPGRSRKSSAPVSPGPHPRHTSASLSNLII
ncbi:hypothetical protein Pmani_004984 [Petrolisthes manimaculis]|uniref:Uncharacterized protein n=1 Tax=Petrolisthes manimaculis TaxID=1843537 RepID=A0AAE1QFS0_9EUCA|nr:hypothetical protein Pmani_004984 [Petrolisthes manimaculis]